MPEPDTSFRLRERKSPEDYLDGYRAALKALKAEVEALIETVHRAEQVQAAIRRGDEKPLIAGDPERRRQFMERALKDNPKKDFECE